MKFKVGDKVSFLNEKRNGLVSRIIGNKMVMVSIEEGFEIPVVESELVLADYSFVEEEIVIPHHETEDFPERFDLSYPTKSKLKQGLYLCFLPDDEKNCGGGKMHIYLTNHSVFDVLFTYSLLQNGAYVCCDFDRVDSETAIKLSTISSSDYENWKAFYLQALYFIKDSTQSIPPLSCEAKVNPVKLYKDDSFSFADIFEHPAICISLNSKTKSDPEVWEDSEWKNIKIEKKSGPKIVGHINDLAKNTEFPEKYLIETGIAEIDLHIEELLDDYSGKSNHELLKLQMDFFSNMLEKAIQAKLKKIIFIHGIGNGSLKSTIVGKLTDEYPFLKFMDASWAKYGKGATEVILS